MDNVLTVKDLVTSIRLDNNEYNVVDHVSLSLKQGEILGLVGESGCGKSMTAMTLMQLLRSQFQVTDGEVLLDGKNLLAFSPKEMESIRGKEISMIFQDVMTSLNPLMKIGHQIMEPMIRHRGLSKTEAKKEAIELLRSVGIPAPEKRFNQYPNTLSGGMRQRVMIAIALSCKPKVLVADEPTTALDVTVQAQILELMKRLRNESNTAIIMITHDLGVVYEMCDRAAVMYCGQIVEEGPVCEIFRNPLHPYTRGLIHAIPSAAEKVDELYSIPGTVPPVTEYPSACRFADRCGHCVEKCRVQAPEAYHSGENHTVRCHLYGGSCHE